MKLIQLTNLSKKLSYHEKKLLEFMEKNPISETDKKRNIFFAKYHEFKIKQIEKLINSF